MSAWGESEIAALRAEIKSQNGERVNWRHVAVAVGQGRTPEQCRSKWRRLQGTAKPRAWAVHERSLLKYVVEEQEQLGLDWSGISTFFYGRTAGQCQTEWTRMKNEKSESGEEQKKKKTKPKSWDLSELSALMSKGETANRSKSAKRGMLYRLRQGGMI